jgi:hypothetical protein
MTWELALQSLTITLAGIGGFFLYDLVREFKTFKTKTSEDIFALRSERENFKLSIRNAELTISHKVGDLTNLHNQFSVDVKKAHIQFQNEAEKIKDILTDSVKETDRLSNFMKKSFDMHEALNSQMKLQREEINSLKVKLGELTIFKTKLNGR